MENQTMNRERYDIKNRFTGAVQCTVEIECDPTAPPRIKLGLAVLVAIRTKANLSGANLSEADLVGANLASANLSGANLASANLSGADLSKADLSKANLSKANLSKADLSEADLFGANLSKANLASANLSGVKIYGLKIATPEQAEPRIKAVAQAALASRYALDMYEWHKCETTHCIAGWAVALAGDEGKALEYKLGPAAAGLILLGLEAATHFYDSQEDGRSWLKSKLAKTGPLNGAAKEGAP